MRLQLRQDVWCACSVDILEYRVKEIRDSSEGTFYILKSKKGVGRFGSIEIMVYETTAMGLKFLELVSPESEYSEEYGLGPFTEGTYHTTLEAARKSFAETQIQLIDREIERLKRQLSDSEARKSKWEKML